MNAYHYESSWLHRLKKTIHFLGTLSSFSLLPTVTPAMAEGILQLSHTEVRLDPGTSETQLYAENKGNSPLFIEVKQELLLNPGAHSESLVPVQVVPQPTLLVSPSRLILAPGQKYRMNLKVLSTPPTARVWRLTFRPRQKVIVEANDSIGRAAPMIMSIGYGAIIYQLPAGT
ncbi:P pilus assembly chaperone PapD [Pseudomonas sp. TE6288]|uniref:hypothetical protein n=1 Tax=Pseudomonas hunanensis TaxID=1247546 RepID=UPI002404C714|nr:hypothetical protein [Pseudomonas hunanensis]MDF9755637.1 P pilus assembly chaperone PapD [Pseudomonas hunanensis]